MTARKLALGCLVLLACSREPEDAGIVLNVDTEIPADRTAIQRIVVTIGDRQQEWPISQPLPGSLGILTSPGTKSVLVDGFAGAVARGRWFGTVLAIKGQVVVQDVHLIRVGSPALDGGAESVDGGAPDRNAPQSDGGASDSSDARDTSGESGGGADAASDASVDSRRPTYTGIDTGGTDLRDARADLPGDAGDGADAPAVPDGPSPDGMALGTDLTLPPSDAAPVTPVPLTGAFSVTSDFAVHATAAAVGPLGDTLRLVRRLTDNPGAAILGFAADAAVPELSVLQSALSSVLYGQLAGWMNAYIQTATVNGVTPYDQLVWLDSTVQALLLYWGLQSTLALPAAGLGTHTPVALSFATPNGPLSFPLDASAVTPGTGITALTSWPDGPNGAAALAVTDHALGLPFGPYALPALNAILLAHDGSTDLASFLSHAIGCNDLAQSVASRCVSIVCVGHASDILAVCEGGLAEGARQIDDQILSLRIQALRLQSGSATAVGAQVSRPQTTTALSDGHWTATVDFGNDPEPADATFFAVAAR